MSNREFRTDAALSRRGFLAVAAALALPPAVARAAEEKPEFALPGPFRGRVVEVFHPGSVTQRKVQRKAVRAMVTRGMLDLTGEKDETAAWRRFFSPGDAVLVKVGPVGQPLSVTQPETLLETIRGLNLAGVKNTDIIVYDRYQDALVASAYDKILPEGVRIAFAEPKVDDVQIDTTNYDTSTYVELPRVHPRADAGNPVHHRSHLARVISRDVQKVVNIGVLKDHASAGITMALKNMSHGFVNNVSRTHVDAATNWCDTFIPAIVQMKAIREKVVLHIGDGLIGTYDGGPGAWNPHFRTWEYRTLFFSTDPVAMDRIGWKIIDARRAEANLPPLAETGVRHRNPGHESYDRQPEHVLLAGKAGLGEADLDRIDHRKVRLGA